MDWQDDAIVLTVRSHGEGHGVLDCLCAERGRSRGYVIGAGSKKLRAVLQPGNGVRVQWRARLDHQLGRFQVEPLRYPAGMILHKSHALSALSAATELLALVLPEQEAQADIYEALWALTNLLEDVEDAVYAAAGLVRLEMGLLASLGYGLDLTRCAATGSTDDLVYVSPKSARAVSQGAGAPYHDKLLPLPGFLLGTQAGDVTADTVADGLRLTGFFLQRLILHPANRDLPPARDRLLNALQADQ